MHGAGAYLMESNMGVGIDYGMGTTNIDPETGIRFGVIHTNNEHLTEWFWESVESDYGDPSCPRCGGSLAEYDSEKHDAYDHKGSGCCDYACESCECAIDSSDCYPDEPIGHTINDDGIVASVDSDGDIFITKSPYYTHAAFCSPCAPGAVHLENHNHDGSGAKGYCLGHDWFKKRKAPYKVYSVATGKIVRARNRKSR